MLEDPPTHTHSHTPQLSLYNHSIFAHSNFGLTTTQQIRKYRGLSDAYHKTGVSLLAFQRAHDRGFTRPPRMHWHIWLIPGRKQPRNARRHLPWLPCLMSRPTLSPLPPNHTIHPVTYSCHGSPSTTACLPPPLHPEREERVRKVMQSNERERRPGKEVMAPLCSHVRWRGWLSYTQPETGFQ